MKYAAFVFMVALLCSLLQSQAQVRVWDQTGSWEFKDDLFYIFVKKGDGSADPQGGSFTPEAFLKGSAEGSTDITTTRGHFAWTAEPQRIAIEFDKDSRILTLEVGNGTGMLTLTRTVRSDMIFNGLSFAALINQGNVNAPAGVVSFTLTNLRIGLNEPIRMELSMSNPGRPTDVPEVVYTWDPHGQQTSFSGSGYITATNGWDWNRAIVIGPMWMTAPNALPTPEPSSGVLVWIGLLSLYGVARQRLK